MDRIERVRARDAERLAAMIAGQIDTLGSFLDPDLIYVHSNGAADGKDSYLESLRAADYVYHDLSVVGETAIPAGEAVILHQSIRATITAKASGQTLTRTMRVSSIWRFDGAEWLLVLLHSTAQP